MSHPNILGIDETVLLVIDLQDPLLKVIHEAESVVGNSVRLVESAKILGIPILVTVQNRARLGGTTKLVAEALPNDDEIDKMTFSCLGEERFLTGLKKLARRQVLICGIESHVCVNQTAHALLMGGFSAHIAADAVSSRVAANRDIAIAKMRQSGCVITNTEMAIFELLGDASREEFKRILPLVK